MDIVHVSEAGILGKTPACIVSTMCGFAHAQHMHAWYTLGLGKMGIGLHVDKLSEKSYHGGPLVFMHVV